MSMDDFCQDGWCEEAGEAALRLPSLPQRLGILERITCEAILDPLVAVHRRRAQWTFFAGSEPATMSGYEGQLEAVGRCLEWFVFDYRIAGLGMTPARHWLEQQAGLLGQATHEQATRCLDFVLGLFEVGPVKAKQGFVAVDLLRRPLTYGVRERLITEELKAGQLLLGRLFPHEGAYVLSGMAALMDSHAAEQIKGLIRAGKLRPGELAENLDGLELENLFGRSVEEIADLSEAVLYERLGRYVETLEQTPWTPDQLRGRVETAPDPLELAEALCREARVYCPHEIDLVYAYVVAAWEKQHGG